MIVIKEIIWISKTAYEAEVLISDGQFEILCFSQPLKKNKGEQLSEPLYAFELHDVFKTDSKIFHAEKLDNAFDYFITGELINKKNGYVRLGKIIIEIDICAIPGDLIEGDFISFKCDRLDIY